MRWQGGGGEAPLALVGKGVCFDTGGISIKPAQGMEDMKCGHGRVPPPCSAPCWPLAGRKARANVVGVVGLVENMPSGNAQRPGDVVRSHGRQDDRGDQHRRRGPARAGGRAPLHAERFKPKAMIDLATLTGAVIVALGHEQAGLFSNDEALAADS